MNRFESHFMSKYRSFATNVRGIVARGFAIAGLTSVFLAADVGTVSAHPHVFVDGGVDFVFDENAVLTGIAVTWLYDPFETLYLLSSLEIDPGETWNLSDSQTARVIAHESNWADTFDGAARLAQGDVSLVLAPPEDFAVRLEGTRLEVRFTRALLEPLSAAGQYLTVTFYEDSFYYAFTIAEESKLFGNAYSCETVVKLFDPNSQLAELQDKLSSLGREETPEDNTVGRFFTDRIYLTCA